MIWSLLFGTSVGFLDSTTRVKYLLFLARESAFLGFGGECEADKLTYAMRQVISASSDFSLRSQESLKPEIK